MINIKGLTDKVATMQVIGCIMQDPLLLAQVDKYRLRVEDFETKFERIIFSSIFNMGVNGAQSISVLDIDSYLSAYQELKLEFDKGGGIAYLQDCVEASELVNFSYYYSRVKKFSALRALDKEGFDIGPFYRTNPLDKDYDSIQKRFDEMSVNDIFDEVKGKIFRLEDSYVTSSTRGAIDAADGLKDLKEAYKLAPEIGSPIQGEILNTIIRGARKGKFYLVSMPTGAGKSRLAVGDACNLSIPEYWDTDTREWVQRPYSEVSLVITTELEEDEIQTLIIAWVSGVNEEIILNGNYTFEEEERVDKAIAIIERYRQNLHLERLPDPNINQIEATVRKHVLTNGVQNVFYDYIFSSPSLLSEYRDLKVREDVILMMLSTALKDLAVELGVFVQSATQLSGDFENKRGIRNQSFLRGSKAVADKCDVGMITLWLGEEEKGIIRKVVDATGCAEPNYVTDIYKGRRSRFRNVKVWSKVDLGTCRREDILVTDGFYRPIDNFQITKYEKLIDDTKEVVEEPLDVSVDTFSDSAISVKKPEPKKWSLSDF